MEGKLSSSIPLVKEIVAQQISQKHHICKMKAKTRNKKFQPGKNDVKLKNIQSPFGNFPKEYFKGSHQNNSQKKIVRSPLYELSYANSNNQMGVRGSKIGWIFAIYLDLFNFSFLKGNS